MRPRTSFVPFVLLLFLIGVGTSAFANVLPAGTPLHIRTTQSISADAGRGTLVRGVVDRSVRIRGQMIIPSGSPATLEVVDRYSRGQRVNLAVHSIRVNGVRYTVSSNEVQLGGQGRHQGAGDPGQEDLGLPGLLPDLKGRQLANALDTGVIDADDHGHGPA